MTRTRRPGGVATPDAERAGSDPRRDLVLQEDIPDDWTVIEGAALTAGAPPPIVRQFTCHTGENMAPKKSPVRKPSTPLHSLIKEGRRFLVLTGKVGADRNLVKQVLSWKERVHSEVNAYGLVGAVRDVDAIEIVEPSRPMSQEETKEAKEALKTAINLIINVMRRGEQ